MKKVLFITEKFPYPLDTGGRIRTYHMLKGLSQEYEITLITSLEQEEQKFHIRELEKVCRRIITVQAPAKSKLQVGLKILKNLWSSIPIVVERHYLHGIADKVKEHAAEFNIVHFDHLDASIYLSEIPNTTKIILDEHNIVSNQIKTTANIEGNPLKRLYMRLQQKRAELYEAKVCMSVTQCFVCSDEDKSYLQGLAKNASIVTIPNGVDVNYFANTLWDTQERNLMPNLGQSVIFVGTLDYGPAGAAVKYFCEDIFPLIYKDLPNAQFTVVGQNPPRYLKTLADRNPRIILTGRVGDVRPYIARSRVFVVPLRSGSGTRLKILSAMAMEVPVVSTTIGAEGLNVAHGENILIANTPEEFSKAVIHLIQNKASAEYISQNARKLVEKIYNWEVIWKDLLAAYRMID